MSTIFFTVSKSKWWVIIVSKPPLILLSYPPLKSKMINLLRKYCEIALQKHKYNSLFEVKKNTNIAIIRISIQLKHVFIFIIIS